MTDVLLPVGWSQQRLREASVITMGQSPPGASYNEDGVGLPFFQGKAEFGSMNPTVKKWTTAGNKRALPGDILLSVRAPVGPTNVADVECVIGRGLAAIRAGENVDQTFLLWFLRGIENEIASKGTGTTFDSISGDTLRSQVILVPPLAEQIEIVRILEEQLSRLDAALASVRVVRTKAARFRRSLLHAAFTGALTGHGASAGALPDGWAEKPLTELCAPGKDSIVDGPFGSNLKRSDFSDSGVPVLKLQNIKPNMIIQKNMDFVSPAKFKTLMRHSFRLGDVVMTKLGNPLGVSAIVTDIEHGVIVADLVRVRPASIDTKFLCYQLNSPLVSRFINENQKGTTRPRINLSIVRNLKLNVPLLAEQQKIVEILEEQLSRLDASLALADVIEKKTSGLRRSLLHAAFTGELTKEWREKNHG